MTGFRGCAVATLLLAAMMIPRTARADDESEARQLFEQGQDQYRKGEYRLASEFFLRAHDLMPSPAFLFNAAQALRLGQDCQRSASLYRQFLADEPRHRERELIEGHLLAMERCAERQRVTVHGAKAETRESAPAPERSDTLAWVLTGVGASFVTASALLAFDSHRASQDVERIFEDGGTWSPAADAIAQRGKSSERLAWVAGGVGVASLAMATYLLLGDSEEGEATSSRPHLSAAKGGPIAGWAWRF